MATEWKCVSKTKLNATKLFDKNQLLIVSLCILGLNNEALVIGKIAFDILQTLDRDQNQKKTDSMGFILHKKILLSVIGLILFIYTIKTSWLQKVDA